MGIAARVGVALPTEASPHAACADAGGNVPLFTEDRFPGAQAAGQLMFQARADLRLVARQIDLPLLTAGADRVATMLDAVDPRGLPFYVRVGNLDAEGEAAIDDRDLRAMLHCLALVVLDGHGAIAPQRDRRARA